MRWLSFLFPLTVLRTSSCYNKDIRVLEESGKYKLLSNGARESGAYIELLWRHALRSFRVTGEEPHVKRILVLGVAGGTVIHMLHAIYPEARITGVDIDPVIIRIGKKYFGLSDIASFRAVTCDARKFVVSARPSQYDLVVVDIFIGPDVPDFVLSETFQRNVKKLLTYGGQALINYLRQPGYEHKADNLQNLLASTYKNVQSADIYNNRFFLAQ